MPYGRALAFVPLLLAMAAPPLPAQPNTVTLRGRLLDSGGEPLTGTRLYRIRFYNAPTGGTQLGSNVEGASTLSAGGLFSIPIGDDVFGPLLDQPTLYYELAFDSATPADGSIDAGDVFPQRNQVTSVLFAQALANQGAGSGLDADLLDGMDSGEFAESAHSHQLADLDGILDDPQIPGGVTRDAEVFDLVLGADGPGSALNADFLDNLDSTDFAAASHAHDYDDLTGSLPESEIPGEIARDAEVFGLVTASDGSGSGLDADLLDGNDSGTFVTQAQLASALAGVVAVPATPVAPTEVRLLPSPLGSQYRRLMWNAPASGGLSNFVVYEYDSDIVDANRHHAQKHYATTTHIDVPVLPNSGNRHYRVAAVNFAGEEGPLSASYVLNTFYWLAFTADGTTNSHVELYLALPTASLSQVVSGTTPVSTNVRDAIIAPDNRTIAFQADINLDDQFDLWIVNIGGLAGKDGRIAKGGMPTPVQVNDVSVAGSDITEFGYSPTSRELVYIADHPTLGDEQLFVYSVADGGTPVHLSTGPSQYPVEEFRFTPDGRSMVYRAETDPGKGIPSDIHELFFVPLDGSDSPVQLQIGLQADETVRDLRVSPSGTHIAYTIAEPGQSAEFLRIAPLGEAIPEKGGGSGNLTTDPIEDENFRFDPNGTRVWFQFRNDDVIGSIPTGGTFPLPLHPEQDWDIEQEFVVGPDGATVFWIGDPDTGGQSELFASNGAGFGSPLRLSQESLGVNRDVFDFKLSPGGDLVAFTADFENDNDREFYVAPVDGRTAPVRISPSVDAGNGVFFDDFEFMPDGQRVLFAGEFEEDKRELYAVDTSGAGEAQNISNFASPDADISQIRVPRYGWDPIEDGFREGNT